MENPNNREVELSHEEKLLSALEFIADIMTFISPLFIFHGDLMAKGFAMTFYYLSKKMMEAFILSELFGSLPDGLDAVCDETLALKYGASRESNRNEFIRRSTVSLLFHHATFLTLFAILSKFFGV